MGEKHLRRRRRETEGPDGQHRRGQTVPVRDVRQGVRDGALAVPAPVEHARGRSPAVRRVRHHVRGGAPVGGRPAVRVVRAVLRLAAGRRSGGGAPERGRRGGVRVRRLLQDVQVKYYNHTRLLFETDFSGKISYANAKTEIFVAL